MTETKTTIEVQSTTADELYRRKGRGQSYDEYLRSLLEVDDEE